MKKLNIVAEIDIYDPAIMNKIEDNGEYYYMKLKDKVLIMEEEQCHQ